VNRQKHVASTQQFCLESSAGRQGLDLSVLFVSSSLGELTEAQRQQISPHALAYIGDAVYELYIRTYYLFPLKRLQDYHGQVVSQVRAESQARHLQILQPCLTPLELEIVRRGRNAASKSSRRIDPVLYQQATGLEALLGYLYLCDPQRLSQLLSQLQLGEATDSPAVPIAHPPTSS
jgi:ribonuclease-3 family protein